MKKPGYYSTGEFAQMAHVTVRTIRYYDKHEILKPSYVNEHGARFYTDEDFVRLQQILLLKYLGFSLEDIREMTIGDMDYRFLQESLKIQLKLVEDRIEQMQTVAAAICDTTAALETEHTVDWNQMLSLIHLTEMEQSIKKQYQNASNISARINLHSLYSQNPQGWFPWILEQCDLWEGMQVLEIGCGNGTLWTENASRIPQNIHIVLSDISEGMLRDARRAIGSEDERFVFQAFDCHEIPYPKDSFDLVAANHVLFYCGDIEEVCREVQRVLKPGGTFVCSAYGKDHMKEITQLVQEFDDRITLSAEKLFERFGKENGEMILSPYFSQLEWRYYQDRLVVPEAEPLISYVLSCHGNQKQYIIDRYKEFRAYVKKKTAKGFTVSKDAGVFVAKVSDKNSS